MNRKKKTTFVSVICSLCVAIALCWFFISFFIEEKLISRFSLWTSLISVTGSIIMAVLSFYVSFLSYKKTIELEEQKIKDEANRFININNDEIAYIPLCLIANSYDKHHKFERKIYNNFNLLNKQTQKEVLHQLNYEEYKLIDNNLWIDKSLNIVSNFIDSNDLGANFLYEGAKYFHRAMKYSKKEYDNGCEYNHIIKDYFHWSTKMFFNDDKISFDSYLESFLDAKKNNTIEYKTFQKLKPFDVLAEIQDFRNCAEDNLCYWVMQEVSSIVSILICDFRQEDDIYYSKGDAEIDTFEDRYLDVLLHLYNLYLVHSNHNNKVQRRKICQKV